MQPAPAARSDRFQELDVFRGLAALGVVLFHYLLRYQIDYGRPDAAPDWVVAAWRAVSGVSRLDGLLPVFWFFIISGFVIVWTLERCSGWRDFAVSRASRLYPAYWAGMAVTVAQAALLPLPGQQVTAPQALANLTMLNNFMGIPAVDAAYWSLAVELLFYLGAGLILALGWLRWLSHICLAWVLACLAHQLMPVLTGFEVPWLVQRFGLLNYGQFFVAGAMFFQLWRGRHRALAVAGLALCVACLFAAYPWRDAVICGGFMLLFALAIAGWLRWIVVPPLLWLGAISYPLYVSHQMAGMRLMAALEAAGWSRAAAAAAALAGALALASLITVAVERPALAAIRGWWRARGLAVTPRPAGP